jgi:hypothetical protein
MTKTTRYSALPESLKTQLAVIEPSRCGRLDYYPCQLLLRTRVTMDRVYVAAETPYISVWGIYPEQDREKFSIRIEDVASLAASPSRLPPQFANQLYQAGESGMGYQIFTLAFSDGTEQAYVTGNAVDFIEYPEGKGPSDVVGVLPHLGRDRNPRPSPKFHWCLYSDGEVPPYATPVPIDRLRPVSYVRRSWSRLLRRLRRPQSTHVG